MIRHSIHIIDLGHTEYKACWELQQQLFEQRAKKLIPDTLLLTEHDNVYTIGKSGNDNHLLATNAELAEKGIAIHHNDRGGDITYHGPGQLVGYPILDLSNYYHDLHRYLRDIEEVIIRTLATFGVTGSRVPEYTGVWVGNDKICAIGVKTSRWITMHGFAFNINTDLAYYNRIIPCGIFERGVTSLQQVLGQTVDLKEVSTRLVKCFGQVFGVEINNQPDEHVSLITPKEAA